MPEFINSRTLSDESIEPTQKLKGTVYLTKDTYLKIDSLIKLSGDTPSRNDIIEKAVDFYFGYSTSQLSQDYLCSVFGQKIEGLIGSLGTRVSRGNFRYAVELDVLSKMVASVLHLTGDQYGKMRKKSIDEVKRTNGTIDIMKSINENESEFLPPK
ncbi:hypothetical protein [Caproicibacter fermentans]|uniref:Uncharacterized protein n=1 Tax=Caproicibacter fermentans TaxID=2576756 RepID=A0A7G8TD75_9FIRM|nr:hypothetical protein [Caproicibacter fermentans]QNK41566.1 hypothetical protein HCR03_04695 [Caproicibacter fermentans]